MAMQSIDVSVVMHTRSRAELLAVALAHLEIQTFPAARFEVIVVDEENPEDAPHILERYAAGTPVRTRFLKAEGSSSSAARNLGLAHAAGKWLLFLDDELLAGPHLVEAHVRAQQRAKQSCVVVGRVVRHPQIDPNIFTRWHGAEGASRLAPNQPLRFIDWRASNMSVSRQAVTDAGGFDESFACKGLEDLELAWRLESNGMRGVYDDSAAAYVWLASTIETERARKYCEGYTLHQLIEKTDSDMVRERYLRSISLSRHVLDTLLGPPSSILCRTLSSDTRMFVATSRLMLRRAFRRGYLDALIGRTPVLSI